LDFREIPSVDRVLQRLGDIDAPRALVVEETRRVLAAIRAGTQVPDIDAEVRRSIEALRAPSLKRVINATGVVLHTNLGRAPGAQFTPLQGYSNLEYDLEKGRRGKRDSHTAGLIERITGKPGIVVNNNAAAVLLVLNELAAGGEAIVSRGELIEIGDGFRIPDIMKASGAALCEVGTTNRTNIDDYRAAINERTRVILRVHPSNFHMTGFTAKPRLDELAALARERGIPLYEDLGSGCVAEVGVEEPLVRESIRAGVNLVSFSGDKLLGGQQAGIITGDAELVARVRKNPLFRALRVDKLVIQALETTLKKLIFEQYDEIPALRMLRLTKDEIRTRAERFGLEIVEGESVAGGGSTPDQTLPTWLLVVPGDAVEVEKKLRAKGVIARIQDGRVVLDLRTVFPEEEAKLAEVLGIPWAKTIFHVGLPLDHPSIPVEDRPALSKRLSGLQERMRAAGYAYEIIHYSPEGGLEGFKHRLRTEPCDGVLIGGGVVSNPEMTYFLEQIVDAVHEAAPHAKVMFHSHSVDVRTTIERWLK
jgi:L-seryl-tRNA(Ser) seleniumtransferase